MQYIPETMLKYNPARSFFAKIRLTWSSINLLQVWRAEYDQHISPSRKQRECVSSLRIHLAQDKKTFTFLQLCNF
jgi:hypothetical protein